MYLVLTGPQKHSGYCIWEKESCCQLFSTITTVLNGDVVDNLALSGGSRAFGYK